MKRSHSDQDPHSPALVENLERRMLLSVSQDVLIGALGAKAVTFTDADGTKATITVKGGGSATVHLSGDTLSQASDRSGVTVSGSNVAVTGITGSRTVRGTVLRVTAKGGNGAVSVGPVTTDGAIGTVDAKGVDLAGLTASGSVTRVTVNRITGGEVSVGDAGTKLNLRVNSDASFDLTAPAVNSISVGGNLTDSTLTFTSRSAGHAVVLRTLSVGGAITNTRLDSEGSVGTVTATKMIGSSILVGVAKLAPGKPLPTTDAEFTSADSIGSVKLKKITGASSFINSDVAAHSVGTLSLGVVQLSNGGQPFGVASGKIASASVVDDSTGIEVKLHNAQTQGEVDDAVSKDHVDLQDFHVNIVP